MKLSGLKTKKAAVEKGLELLILRRKQEQIKELRGQIQWRGDLEQMRRDDG